MIKVFCDLCGKELGKENMEKHGLKVYPGISCPSQDYEDPDDYWMIEHACDSCIKDLYKDIVKATDKIVESYLDRGVKKIKEKYYG